MRKNRLKEKLQAGKAVFGVLVTMPSPPIVEILGYLGFDWVLLDNEHGSITVGNCEEVIRGCELSGITPIVRPITNRPDTINPFLDRGAQGVQVPHVNTADEARAAVDAVKYYPEGHRGIFGRGRPNDYGFAAPPSQYVVEANRETLVCVMIEEVEGMENLGDMLRVDGVDVYFIGSGDLSQSMGYPGQQTHPEVLATVDQGIAQIRAAGKVAGVSCPDSLVPRFLEKGVRYFHSNVNSLLQASSEAYLKRVREVAARVGS